MIEKINVDQKVLETQDFLLDYLYPYVLRFACKNELDYDKILVLSKTHIPSFLITLEVSLKELLDDCYKEPQHKQRSKFPSRYEKISIADNTYIVDYRKDIIGKIAFRIYSLIKELERLTTD